MLITKLFYKCSLLSYPPLSTAKHIKSASRLFVFFKLIYYFLINPIELFRLMRLSPNRQSWITVAVLSFYQGKESLSAAGTRDISPPATDGA